MTDGYSRYGISKKRFCEASNLRMPPLSLLFSLLHYEVCLTPKLLHFGVGQLFIRVNEPDGLSSA